MWAWGENMEGELGDGQVPGWATCTDQNYGPNCSSATPVQVVGLAGVTAIADRLALKSDGTVWQWGGVDNQNNALPPARVFGVDGATAIAG